MILTKWDMYSLELSIRSITPNYIHQITIFSGKQSIEMLKAKVVSFRFDFILFLKWRVAVSKLIKPCDYTVLFTSFWWSHWHNLFVKFILNSLLNVECVDVICHSLKWLWMPFINFSDIHLFWNNLKFCIYILLLILF